MGQLTIDIQKKVLSWLLHNSAYPVNPPLQPIMVHLMSSNGNNATRGVEVSGDSYVPEVASWIIPDGGVDAYAVNSSEISFSAIDSTSAVSVAGIELWDSSSTPQRIAYGELEYPVSVGPNQSFTIAVEQIKVRLV